MTDPDWRSRRWDATHHRIYEAAMALFTEHGFERVNVAQIAAGAGVSVPTFYAHYPSKEHLVMQLPTAEQMQALLSAQPSELSLRERLAGIASVWVGQWGPEQREGLLARWRVIAAVPALRTRAAEFERTTAEMISAGLPAEPGSSPRPTDAILVNAYMTAFTAALLAWADGNGERKLEELIDESFEALQAL